MFNKKAEFKLDGIMKIELGTFEVLGKKEKHFKCEYKGVVAYAGTPEEVIDTALEMAHPELRKLVDGIYESNGTLKKRRILGGILG